MQSSTAPAYYPAFLNLTGKKCLVIGGGAIAVRKAKSLKSAGADVVMVAKKFSSGARRIKNITRLNRRFLPKDVDGAWLVIAATGDKSSNEAVFGICQKKRIFVNIVDEPDVCGFIAPSVVRQGPITFAVSTGGSSPALSKFIRRKLQTAFGPKYAQTARMLGRLRPKLLKLQPRERKKKIKEWIQHYLA